MLLGLLCNTSAVVLRTPRKTPFGAFSDKVFNCWLNIMDLANGHRDNFSGMSVPIYVRSEWASVLPI